MDLTSLAPRRESKLTISKGQKGIYVTHDMYDFIYYSVYKQFLHRSVETPVAKLIRVEKARSAPVLARMVLGPPGRQEDPQRTLSW